MPRVTLENGDPSEACWDTLSFNTCLLWMLRDHFLHFYIFCPFRNASSNPWKWGPFRSLLGHLVFQYLFVMDASRPFVFCIFIFVVHFEMLRVNIGNGDPSEACWGTLVVYFFCYGCLAPLLAFLYFLSTSKCLEWPLEMGTLPKLVVAPNLLTISCYGGLPPLLAFVHLLCMSKCLEQPLEIRTLLKLAGAPYISIFFGMDA